MGAVIIGVDVVFLKKMTIDNTIQVLKVDSFFTAASVYPGSDTAG